MPHRRSIRVDVTQAGNARLLAVLRTPVESAPDPAACGRWLVEHRDLSDLLRILARPGA